MSGPAYMIKVPHKRQKSAFKKFPDDFNGTLRNDPASYGVWLYWVLGVPGTDVETGWYSEKPSVEYMQKWKEFIETHNEDGFAGNYRELFGFNSAAKLFDKMSRKYK